MRKLLHIALILLLAAACNGPRKMDRDDMEEALYQMLIQDQQIKQDRKLKAQADSSLVYEGIFASLGYDTDDFIYSLEYYLEEPARMEKVMESVADRLEAEAKEAGEAYNREQWRNSMMRLYKLAPNLTSLPQPRPSGVDTLPVRFTADSIHLVNSNKLKTPRKK